MTDREKAFWLIGTFRSTEVISLLEQADKFSISRTTIVEAAIEVENFINANMHLV